MTGAATATCRRAAARRWYEQTAATHASWLASCQNPAAVQAALLQKYLRANAKTVFGRAHRFASIRSITQFQEQVPIASPVDFQDAFDRIARGERAVLTAEPVLRLVPTSGTHGAVKWIPYTRTLLKEFQRGLRPWLHDLFHHHPALRGGAMYWALSPAGGDFARRQAAIPVGFAQDTDYLSVADARCAAHLMAVPPELSEVKQLDSWRYTTLRFLLAESNLRLISIWNPSFLLLLLEALSGFAENLVADLARGSLTPPEPLAPALHAHLTTRLHPAPVRARAVGRILARMTGTNPSVAGRLWPRLALVSCWTDGWARLAVPALRKYLPGIAIQAKGLLATEACVTIPCYAGTARSTVRPPAPALAVGSHFFEFAEAASGRIRLAHELRIFDEYQVIITTGGGLYRYRLNDRVKVVGHLAGVPRLQFLGKTAEFSDLCGEKLAESHVADSIARAWKSITGRRGHASRQFGFLAPQPAAQPPRYGFYTDVSLPPVFLKTLEQHLQSNPHYRWARRFGQLAPLIAEQLPAGSADAYRRLQARRGTLATAKPRALEAAADWCALLMPQPPN